MRVPLVLFVFAYLFSHTVVAERPIAKEGYGLEGFLEKIVSPEQVKPASNQLVQRLGESGSSVQIRGVAQTNVYVAAADLFGGLVDKAREYAEVPTADLLLMVDDADQFHRLSKDMIRRLERAANEDEAALEGLYRSEAWYDMNYSLATFRYWQAWLHLLVASRSGQESQQHIVYLARATKGFQSTAVRIVYPGLVYGSWLGLAYVELARGNLALAQERLEKLQAAIMVDIDNPLLSVVEQELAVLLASQGTLSDIAFGPSDNLTDSEARILFEESLYLLKQHRKNKVGAIEAAQRLRTLYTSGRMYPSRLTRLMHYSGEILGQDLGLISRLIEVGHSFEYEQYNIVVLKYQEFESSGGDQFPFDVGLFRYKYAVALYELDRPRKSLDEIRSMQKDDSLPDSWSSPEIRAASLSHLRFLVTNSLYQKNATDDSAKDLYDAAKAHLSDNPDHKDIGRAWLALGLVSADEREARSYLTRAKSSKNIKKEAESLLIERLFRQFNQAGLSGELSNQKNLASDIIEQFNRLSKNQKEQPLTALMAIRSRIVLELDYSETLDQIDRIQKRNDLDNLTLQRLFATRLSVLDSCTSDCPNLIQFIQSTFTASPKQWQQRELFKFIVRKEKNQSYKNLAELAEFYIPTIVNQSDTHRQLLLLQIRTLIATGRIPKAYEAAKQSINLYPQSGDAWLAYSDAAERAGAVFQAERAWAKVANGSPPGSAIWLRSMIKQIELQAGESALEQSCALARTLQTYAHLLEGALLQQFRRLRASIECPDSTVSL